MQDLQDLFAFVNRKDRNGTASRNDAKKVIPATANTSTVFLDEFLQWNTHLLLHNTRVVDVPRNAEQLSALISLPAERGKPLRPTPTDSWCNCNSLDVCNRRWAPEQTDICREWWLQTRLALLSLQTLNQSSFLSTDIRSCATMKVDVEAVTWAARILPQEASAVRFVDCLLNVARLLVEFTTNVDVRCGSVHCTTSHKTSFHKLVWVPTHDLAVFAGAWLTLVSIDDKVTGTRILFPSRFVHEAPFETWRKASTTATSQTWVLDGLNNPRISLEDKVFRSVPVTSRLISKSEVCPLSRTSHGAPGHPLCHGHVDNTHFGIFCPGPLNHHISVPACQSLSRTSVRTLLETAAIKLLSW